MAAPKSLLSSPPFHAGEIALQRSIGAAERMADVGRRMIRNYMPDQHREFFAQLPFIVVGTVDRAGDAWASFATGAPGFLSSPDPQRLVIAAARDRDDPADSGMDDGASIGLLGIELYTRRRNRMNGRMSRSDDAGFVVDVEHSFGNCPKYITLRDFRFVEPATQSPLLLDRLDERARAIIAEAETFFVATYADIDGARQVDVSHRGGNPGFVRLGADGALMIPDFAGNHHFNTLGNISMTGRAGLLFIDYETGDMLQLSGEAEVKLEVPEVEAFQGSERFWSFIPRRIVYRAGALPIRWDRRPDGASPFSQMTGSWEDTDARLDAAKLGNSWRPYRVTRIVDETGSVRSVYLVPADGHAAPTFKAGQYLTLRLTDVALPRNKVLTYSLSSAPSDGMLRISVKRQGLGSGAIHRLAVGDTVEARLPAGTFVIDVTARRPIVFLAAGIGVTPLLSMAKHVVFEMERTQRRRLVWFFHAAHDRTEQPFVRELAELATRTGETFRLIRFLTDTEDAASGKDFELEGRPTIERLKTILPFDDYDFYLCGPSGFMQDFRDGLVALNVNESRIHAETFGPAGLSLRRTLDADESLEPAAREGVDVVFETSNLRARWEPGSGTLLDLAERSGVYPDFSCRAGECGTCRTEVVSGSVTYPERPEAGVGPKEVLLCQAVPSVRHPSGDSLIVRA